MTQITARLRSLNEQRDKWLRTVNDIGAKPEANWTAEDRAEIARITSAYQAQTPEYDEAVLENKTLNSLRAHNSQMLTVEKPISGGNPSGSPSLNFRTEPWKWTSGNSRQRIITPSSNEKERFFATDDYTKCMNEFLRSPKSFNRGGEFIRHLEAKGIGHESTLNILRADDDTRGGLFTLAEEMMAGVLKELDNETFISRYSRQLVVNSSDTLGIMRRTAKANFVGPRSELSNYIANKEENLQFGKRSMKTNEFGLLVLLSDQLLASAMTDMWALYLDEIKLVAGEWLEEKSLTGTGNSEPLGVLTVDSVNGIGTDRDVRVVTGDLGGTVPSGWTIQTKFGFRTILNGYFGLKPQHRAKARWMFHSNQMINLALMTDDGGRLIWQPSARDGEPSRLLGLPVDESLWLSGTEAADEYFGMLNNWDYYWTIWHKRMTIRYLTELFALNAMTGALMNFQMDAAPVLSEAFTRLQYASA